MLKIKNYLSRLKRNVQVGMAVGVVGKCEEGLPGIFVRIDHPLVLQFIKHVTMLPLEIEGKNKSLAIS